MFSYEQIRFKKDAHIKELVIPIKFRWETPQPNSKVYNIEVFYFHNTIKGQPSKRWPCYLEYVLAGRGAVPAMEYDGLCAPFNTFGDYVPGPDGSHYFVEAGEKVYQAKVVAYSDQKFCLDGNPTAVCVLLGSKDKPYRSPRNVAIKMVSSALETEVNSNPVPGLTVQFCIKTGDSKKIIWDVTQELVPKNHFGSREDVIAWVFDKAVELPDFRNGRVKIVSDAGVHQVIEDSESLGYKELFRQISTAQIVLAQGIFCHITVFVTNPCEVEAKPTGAPTPHIVS